jgi:hypothetical protein
MRHRPGLILALPLVLAWNGASVADTFPPITTVPLCGPGTNWLSLPTHSDLMTAADLCAAVGPAADLVSQRFPDGPGSYTYECATTECTPPDGGPADEAGCPASSCFCVHPGEGFQVTTVGAASLPINGCDEFVSLTLPMLVGSGLTGTLVSIPYSTFLATANDLGIYFGLTSSGVARGTVSGFNCATGTITSCSVGTAACDSFVLVPGQAYQLRNTVSGDLTALNPAICAPPSAAPCPMDSLTVDAVGGGNVLTWDAPADCSLPLEYEVARGDLGCLAHHCSHCESCTILGTTTGTTLTDASPPSTPVWYLVRVIGGSWNGPGPTQCTDRDIMFGLGCP